MKRIMAIIPLLMIATASLAADEKDITSDNAVMLPTY